jgi:hypothetical protein
MTIYGAELAVIWNDGDPFWSARAAKSQGIPPLPLLGAGGAECQLPNCQLQPPVEPALPALFCYEPRICQSPPQLAVVIFSYV